MKKCKGCGQELQYEYPKKIGYAQNENQEYCQRCFRLTHYGDIEKLKSEKIDNKSIIELYKSFNKDDVYVLIVDVFDALTLDKDDLLKVFKNRKVILIINKLDLLPLNMNDDKITKEIIKMIKNTGFNFKEIILTHQSDRSFNELFFETLKQLNRNKVIFAGRVNAGKSTIINKLIGNNDLTVSTYPGTTITLNEIEFNNYVFIDTPGLIDENSFINNLDKSKMKELVPNKCVKPKVFQLYNHQSYFIEGLLRIDLKPQSETSLTFFIKNELEIHRTKYENADNYFKAHLKEMSLKFEPFEYKTYKVDKDITFYVKGLGYFKINGKSSLRIGINSNIKVYRSEVSL